MAHDTSPVHTPIARVTGIGIALAAVLGIILLAFMWPTITSSVKGTVNSEDAYKIETEFKKTFE